MLSQFFPVSPTSTEELYQRALSLAGHCLGDLAVHAKISIPPNLERNKGWVGMLLEFYLGASAGSKPDQDFPQLGIELKTIPVTAEGKPLETTFVCSAPLVGNHGITWETSHVRHKLQQVLWIPVRGERAIPLAERQIGWPLLWQPNRQEEQQLKRDWEELMDLIVLGRVESITARHGEFLQLRPKAAHSRILTQAVGEYGQPIMTLPRGFYLKKNFTSTLITRYFLHPSD